MFSAFLTPANAMLSVELSHLADVLDDAKQGKNVSQLARQYSKRIHDAIWDTTVVNNIFAYETNGNYYSLISWVLGLICCTGFGGRYVMDDANVPVSNLYKRKLPLFTDAFPAVATFSTIPRISG